MTQTKEIPNTPNQFFKSLSILHLAMCAGAAMICIFLWYSNGFSMDINTDFSSDVLLYILPFVVVAAPYLGSFLYKQKMAAINKEDKLSVKMMTTRSAQILRFACIEGPILICAIVYFTTNNFLYLICGFILLLYFFSLRPAKANILESMQLTSDDKTRMSRGDVHID